MTDRNTTPKLEIRIPISPTEKDMRMVHYLLESLQTFGGHLGRAAHCVCSVGADEPPRDLRQEYKWTARHSIDFHWVDRELFRQRSYDATGFDRLWIESDADVVAMVDADIFIAGDFDRIIIEAHRDQKLLGFIAHVSPFDTPELNHFASHHWWSMIFEAAGLPCPPLDWEHTGWGLMSNDPAHRRCPAYYNYGFVIAPKAFMDRIGETFEAELDAVDRIVETWFKSQIAHTLAISRHSLRHGAVPINYNFPLHVPADAIRALNPDPDGRDDVEDIRIFHYLGDGEINRRHFATDQAVEELLNRSDLSAPGRVFQRKLGIVNRRIVSQAAGLAHLDVSEH